MRHSPKRERRHRLIGSTLTVQFATWPASVSCLRVWPDRDRFASGPLAPRNGAKCGRHAKGDDDHGHAISGQCSRRRHAARSTAQDTAAAPVIRTIGLSDLHRALRLGWEDFKAVPSHAIILCVIYPVLGLVLARTVLGYSVLPLLFPLAAGFALLGPFAALGLYELSRRRETGEQASAWDAIEVFRSPSFGAMLGLGTLLLALFVVWVATAQAIYVAAFGYEAAAGIPDFARRVLTTPQGWWLIVAGCGVGFLFAVVALCVSVVSFPLMLDRHAGAGDAMVTSLRAVARNPVPMAAWGLIVAVLLVAGSLPFFLGLAIVIPLLGHATWHLYREVVVPELNPQPLPPRPPRERRPAADFPANLFPWRRKDDALNAHRQTAGDVDRRLPGRMSTGG